MLKPDIENGRRAAVGDGGTDEVEDAGSAPSDHRARVGDGGGTDGGGTGGTGSGNSGTKACAGELVADGIADGGVELELGGSMPVMSPRPTPKKRESFTARRRRARKLASCGLLTSDDTWGEAGASGESGAGGDVGAEIEPRGSGGGLAQKVDRTGDIGEWERFERTGERGIWELLEGTCD